MRSTVAEQVPVFTEQMAKNIVILAVLHDQEQELLNCLANGGGVTIDPERKELVLITEEQLMSLNVYDISEADDG
jgi:hypothetical protein